MYKVERTRNVGMQANEETLQEWLREPCDDDGRGRVLAPLPVPAVAPRDFVVRVGDGWGGPLHELADALAVWERGASAAAGVLLSWLEFIDYEVEGFEECRDLVEGLGLLRGAVMLAGSGQRLEACGYMMEAGIWDREFWERLGR